MSSLFLSKILSAKQILLSICHYSDKLLYSGCNILHSVLYIYYIYSQACKLWDHRYMKFTYVILNSWHYMKCIFIWNPHALYMMWTGLPSTKLELWGKLRFFNFLITLAIFNRIFLQLNQAKFAIRICSYT